MLGVPSLPSLAILLARGESADRGPEGGEVGPGGVEEMGWDWDGALVEGKGEGEEREEEEEWAVLGWGGALPRKGSLPWERGRMTVFVAVPGQEVVMVGVSRREGLLGIRRRVALISCGECGLEGP